MDRMMEQGRQALMKASSGLQSNQRPPENTLELRPDTYNHMSQIEIPHYPVCSYNL